MVTVVTRPNSYRLTEVPVAIATDPREGGYYAGYDDPAGTVRRWVLRWFGSLNTLILYRHLLSSSYGGRIGALFDWRPPREADTVRARRVSPIRNINIQNPRSVSFEVEFEQHKTS